MLSVRFSNKSLHYFVAKSRSAARELASKWEGRVIDLNKGNERETLYHTTMAYSGIPVNTPSILIKPERFENVRWVVEIEGVGSPYSEDLHVGDTVLLCIDHPFTSTSSNPNLGQVCTIHHLPREIGSEEHDRGRNWMILRWIDEDGNPRSNEYPPHSNFYLPYPEGQSDETLEVIEGIPEEAAFAEVH